MKRLAVFVLLALIASSGVPVFAQQSESRAIVQKMIERNPDLRTFQARVHVDVRMLSFPFYSPKLDGTSYFKRPDNYQVVFDRVPPFARGLDHFFSDLADPSTWERRFDITTQGRSDVNGRRVVQLKLVAKIRGMIDHTDVYVDPSTYEVARLQWHYYNGGLITMDQTYRNVGNFNLLSSQHAEIHVPHIRAVADSQYNEYHTNIAVSESVFTELHK
ncbi:MAG: outer membrane lipoprotein carrier protein LolA [Candidatus Baltobacteraceae bacterium]